MAGKARTTFPKGAQRISPAVSAARAPRPLNHALLAAAAVVVVLGAGAGAIQFLGDPQAGAPRKVAELSHGGGDMEPVRPQPLVDVIVDPSIDGAMPPEMTGAEGEEPDFMALEPPGGAAAPAADPLPPAPIAAVSREGPEGLLPVIGPKGLTPFTAYRRPFTAEQGRRPIAIVVGGLGYNVRATQQAIDELPADVTLSFVPYVPDLQGWIDRARADGHEVLIEAPMEPFENKGADTGPQTLRTNLDAKTNISRLETLLAKGAGYIGVMNYQGAKFSANAEASGPIVKALKGRGLAMVGNGISGRAGLGAEARKQGLAFSTADRVLDVRQEAEAIDEQLLNLEALALQNGGALGVGFAYPVTIEQVSAWAANLDQRGYQLAPASALLDQRKAPR
jgi:hypothetical protein